MNTKVFIQKVAVRQMQGFGKPPAQEAGRGAGSNGPGSELCDAHAHNEETVIRAATERTVSKAAIAVARLCLDPVIADQVVELGGLEILYPLAETSSKGPSETIRIAALAAIKTISVYSSVTEKLLDTTKSDYYSSEIPTSSLESFV